MNIKVQILFGVLLVFTLGFISPVMEFGFEKMINLSDGYGYFGDIDVLGNVSSGNLTVENELRVVSGNTIYFNWLTMRNMGTHTYMSGDLIVHDESEATTSLGIHAHNGSVMTNANLVLEAGSDTYNSVLNIVKNSPLHPLAPNSTGWINEGGNIGMFVPHDKEIIWFHYDNLTKDEYGDIEYLGGAERLMTLNDTGLILEDGDLIINGSARIFEDLNVYGDLNLTGDFYYEDNLYNSLGSGWLSGGGLLWNPGTNTFDLATDVNYIIVNQSDGNNIQIQSYTYPAEDNINIGSVINQERWVALSADENGNPQMDFLTLNLTANQRRDYAIIGRVWTDENGFITGTGPYVEMAYGYGKTLEDLIITLGSTFNIEGNVFSANGANMLLDKTSGRAFRYGAWSVSQPASPSIGNDPEETAIDAYYYFTSNVTSHNLTSTIQLQWENNGVLEEMPSNKFQCQQIWHWSYSQVVAMQYGQKLYSKMDEAQAGCQTDPFTVNAELTSGAKLRGWLIMKTGTTELNDGAMANFITAPNIWFGISGGGAGASYSSGVGIDLDGLEINLNTTYTDDRYFNTPNETGEVDLTGTFNVRNNLDNIIVSAGPTIGGVLTDYGILNLYRSDGSLGARINAGSSSSQPTHLQIPMGFGGNTQPRGHIDASSHNILAARLYLNPGGSGTYMGYPFARIAIDGSYGGIRLGHSPQEQLDTMAASIDGGYIIYNTDTNTTEYFDGTDWISMGGLWTENGTNIYLRNLSQNVGIGIASPTQKLDVNGTLRVSNGYDIGIVPNALADDFFLQSDYNTGMTIGGGVSTSGSIYFADTDSNSVGRIDYFHLTDAMGFSTGGNRDMTIANEGNLGIGTANPSAKLHLFSDTSGTVLNVESEYGAGGSVIQLISNGNGTNWGEAQVILSTNQSENRWFMFMDDSSLGDLGDANRLGFWSDGVGTVMTLDGDNGNVGIGTINPINQLHVYSPSNAGGITIDGDSNPALTMNHDGITTGYLASVDGAGNYFTDSVINDTILRGEFGLKLGVLEGAGGHSAIAIDSLGRVGIGTGNPNKLLTIHTNSSSYNKNIAFGDDGNGNLNIYMDDSFSNPLPIIQRPANTSDLYLGDINGLVGSTYIMSNGEKVLSALSDGKVGIGTATPQNTLNVIGDGNFTGNLYVYGNFTFHTVAYEDLRFPANTFLLTGTFDPVFDGSSTGWGYKFDKWDQVIVIAEMPQSRKDGSNIKIHFHWSPTTTNAGDVQWGVEYKWANIDGTFPSGTTVYVVDSTGLLPAKHQVTDDIVINGAGINAGSILKARVLRSNNPTYDTYGDSAMLMEFDIEYEIDKIGSPT